MAKAGTTKARGTTARAAGRPRYQSHPILESERGVRKRLEQQTGRSWSAWLRLAKQQGPDKERPLKAWLMREHGIRPMAAAWLAHEALSPADVATYDDPVPLVDALYSGSRSALRPVHEAVVDALLALGPDVVVTACKTMVPAYRKHVVAELRPVDGAVEVRLALGDVPAGTRLKRDVRGAPDGRLTHAVRVASASEVDAQLRGWLAQAYAQGLKPLPRAAGFRTPPGLAQGLKASKPAARTWASLTPAMQRDMAVWISSAKQAATQAKRLATVLAKLRAGQRRVY